MSKVPVLVTGGAGYIGSHAVLALRDAGWDVAVIDNLSTGTRYLVPDEVTFYEGNVADRELVDRIFAERNIGAILHFAGSIVVPESVEKPLEYYRNNTIASHALVSAAVDAGVQARRLLLHRGGLRRAGARAGRRDGREAADQSVRSVEADDRAHARGFGCGLSDELCGAALFQRVRRGSATVASGQVGKGSTHLIKVAVEAAVGKRDHIDVYGTDYPTEDGSCVRDYIHVSDLVAAHVKALERLIEKPDENLVLNLGYGRGLSVLEVLDALDRLLPEPIRREMKGRRAGDPPLLISSNEALKATLDWQARYADIDTILTHALEWERKLLSRNWA